MHPAPNPYRVLAFAVECGDRHLSALLSARLFRTTREATAAWRTFARPTVALDLA
jgi:hypothetical protein